MVAERWAPVLMMLTTRLSLISRHARPLSANADVLFARSQAKIEDIDRKLMVAMGKEFNQLSEE